MIRKICICLFAILLFSFADAQEIYLQNNWSFRNLKESQTFPAKVPGTIHSDLKRNKLIPDPYISNNIDSVQWVEKEDWEYSCLFDFDLQKYKHAPVRIVFDGIDTYSEVYLNGISLGTTNNMFRTWRYDITSLLKEKNNRLTIRLFSASRIADSLANAYPVKLPCENSRNFIRKAQYHFGWDFAPRLVTCGIWRDVKLEVNYSDAVIEKTISHVELVQKPDSKGKSFYFKINGKAVFMKGVNWVPADMILPDIADEKYRSLLIAAKDAGVNMLRVWGGGVYEKNIFYALCDSLGIYVWQDLMFAGAMYPSDSVFVNNVMEEIRENINRLKKYKCIVLWCGNNEIDEAWHNWDWQEQYHWSDSLQNKIWNDYQSLFEQKIPELISELDDRPYISSSPKYGWGRKESLTEGDMHYWGVWWGMEPLRNYKIKIPRFMSEYGMQSMPCMESFKFFCSEKDLDTSSVVMKAHQRHPTGFQTLAYYLKEEKFYPADFKSYVSSTQELQSRALQIAIEAHLKARPYCMGTLAWQWDDCWPAISWSIIDYYGNKKKAYYTMQKLFKNGN